MIVDFQHWAIYVVDSNMASPTDFRVNDVITQIPILLPHLIHRYSHSNLALELDFVPLPISRLDIPFLLEHPGKLDNYYASWSIYLNVLQITRNLLSRVHGAGCSASIRVPRSWKACQFWDFNCRHCSNCCWELCHWNAGIGTFGFNGSGTVAVLCRCWRLCLYFYVVLLLPSTMLLSAYVIGWLMFVLLSIKNFMFL